MYRASCPHNPRPGRINRKATADPARPSTIEHMYLYDKQQFVTQLIYNILCLCALSHYIL